MRDKWYSDNRDLVKWSALLHIARKYLSDSILYIAYLRQSHYGKIEVDGKEYEIPSEVISQFRDVRSITKMISRPNIRILHKEFGDRSVYLNAINNFILENCKKERCIVFLDPDTGLEPSGKVSHNHVLMRELKEIWKQLPSNWIIAFYQHQTNRSGEEWVKPKRKQFSEAIGIPLDDVKVASGFDIAKDVVFFFAIK